MKCPDTVDYIQGLEDFMLEEQHFIRTSGLCVIWSLWFVELMMANPKKNPSDVILYMTQGLERRGIRPSSEIRLYLMHLMKVFYQLNARWDNMQKSKQKSNTPKFEFGSKNFYKMLTVLAGGTMFMIYHLT